MKLCIYREPRCLERTIHQNIWLKYLKSKNISGNENLESPDMMLGHGDVKNTIIKSRF